MSTTTPSLSHAPQWAWDQITELLCRATSEGYDLGYSRGWAAAQEQAEQGSVNRHMARAGVANIGTEISRAKADGRPPRLYTGRAS